ncbi:hypothetical protein D1BOALGB6SA_6499 [Olavius sp. associated proteobacterium Delta 1]|nr:hypothetical protein D1BOALGB6SA_6499 [Olavius sp. associated proteobacterium Delta 1]
MLPSALMDGGFQVSGLSNFDARHPKQRMRHPKTEIIFADQTDGFGYQPRR